MLNDKKRKNTLVASDLIRLNTFFTNTEFDFIKDNNFNQDTLETMLGVSRLTGDVADQLLVSLQFTEYMKPYYNVYLMIKELQLTEYNDWVSMFEQSEIVKYYERFADRADRFIRFIDTLIGLDRYRLV